MKKVKKLLIGVSLGVVVLVSVLGGALSDRIFGYRILDSFIPLREQTAASVQLENQRILNEESIVVDVVEQVSPSVVTIGISKTQRSLDFSGFEGFPFFFGLPQGEEKEIEQDIATGFIISNEGLVVTNRHVVDDTKAEYKVITDDDKTYEVTNIYRDPVNDIAILKINPDSGELKPVELGDSSKLKVGQFSMAIGTALGELRHTVTTGVISGLGRGINAGSPFQGSIEKIDDVIQTEAAINPGNSGGPLLNSIGQVIGVNVATAANGQNIGFAIPINVVKESIENFNKTGQFSRAFLGVRYRIISREVAIMNEVPEGAYVVEVIPNSPAQEAGIITGDILTYFDGKKINKDQGDLARFISEKKVGGQVEITLWRNREEKKLKIIFTEVK